MCRLGSVRYYLEEAPGQLVVWRYSYCAEYVHLMRSSEFVYSVLVLVPSMSKLTLKLVTYFFHTLIV